MLNFVRKECSGVFFFLHKKINEPYNFFETKMGHERKKVEKL